jgi:hypothetical protein
MTAFADSADQRRKATRKQSSETTCRLDRGSMRYNVYDLSAHGFSFLCEQTTVFRKGVELETIEIADGEHHPMILASGTVVHLTQYDDRMLRVGVHYEKKTLDRTLAGTVRTPRHFPRIPLNAVISSESPSPTSPYTGHVVDFTASTARIAIAGDDEIPFAIGSNAKLTIAAENEIVVDTLVSVVQQRNEAREMVVRFLGPKLDIAHVTRITNVIVGKAMFLSSLDQLGQYDSVSFPFKSLISDWRMYLTTLRRLLDQEQRKQIHNTPEEQNLFLACIEPNVVTVFRGFISRMNEISDNLGKKESLPYKEYFRANLNEFWLAAPLGASVINKECGYPGDFETIKQFFGDPSQGSSLFDKLINRFIASMDAVMAHKHRVAYLARDLHAAYVKQTGNFSFLSLGSGSAEEILTFVEESELDRPVHATLIDLDAYALADFSDRLQYLATDQFDARLVNADVLALIRGRNDFQIEGPYDMSYCAGLFDYFSDRTCKRILSLLIENTRSGGIVIVTNVHRNNHTRHFMDYGGAWDIVHRDEDQMRSLIELPFELQFDDTKANMFVKIQVRHD